jgi:hypothetical protein
MNMAKGWTRVETVNNALVNKETPAEKRRRIQNFEKAIRKTPKLNGDDFKKQSDKFFIKKKEQEDSLVQAYKNKKLKSVKAIKEAQQILKSREKAKEKAAAKENAVG